jgi:hypothetical protein
MEPVRCCFYVIEAHKEYLCSNHAVKFYIDELMTRAWANRSLYNNTGKVCLIPRCILHIPGMCNTSGNGYKEISYEEFVITDVLNS